MGSSDTIEDQVFKNFQKMDVNDEDVNILLLGETGVGKSTFINSFANYLEYNKFDIAEQNKVRCLIPAKFTVTNEDFEEKVVEIGRDDNENNTISESATLETRSYVFPLSKQGISRIRLIDTPGIGDTRGIDHDNENMENILSYISHLENLHAICFLLKPNNTRITVMFHYCIKQLLSRLEKSASKNIIFLFTNTRSSFYKPGDTTTALKTILEDIKSKPPYTDIKFTKHNVFCLDNESFRYMVAIKSGIQLGNKDSFAESWIHSVRECWRMIHFISGKENSAFKITPHKVKDTISVNEARRTILQLSQPLADIADLINDNISTLERHNKSLQMDNTSITQLKQNLYVPVINLRCKELTQPTTVCSAHKCCEVYMVGTIKKYHYKQRCHDPCYLQNVPKELVGSPELIHCWAMNGHKCKMCSCDFSTHMHIYYVSETYEDKIDNEGVKAQIKDRETALSETKKLITKIEARKSAYENEKDTIIKTMAKFAHFLQHNAIAPYNDAYKAYIEYLIDREKSLGTNCDHEIIKYHNGLLKRYNEEKKVLDDAVSSNSGSHSNVSAASVFDSVQNLYRLPHTGKQIEELYSRQLRNRNAEHKNTEIVLDKVNESIKQKTQDQKKNKWKNKKQYNQSQNNVGKMRIKQNDHSPMKAKDRGINKGYKNINMNPQNFPNLRHMNTPGYGQGNFQNQFKHPSNVQNELNSYTVHPQFIYPDHAGVPYRSQPGNFDTFSPGFHGNSPNFHPGQQPGNFSSYPVNQGSFSNLPGSRGSFANQPGQQTDFLNYIEQQNLNRSDYQAMLSRPEASKNRNTGEYRTGTINDPNFDEWYKNIMGNRDNTLTENRYDTNVTFRHFNNLSKKVESSEEDNDDSSQSNDEPDDDEDFKEFMKKNKLEYLVEPSKKSSNINKNTNKTEKNRRSNNSSSAPRSYRYQDNSDSDDRDNNEDAKAKTGKGIFSLFKIF